MTDLNNLIEIYIPDSMEVNGEVVKAPKVEFDIVHDEVKDILLSKCSGCSERWETGYYQMGKHVNEMKNLVVYAYYPDTVSFNLDIIHTLINEVLSQKCSMICINHKADIA